MSGPPPFMTLHAFGYTHREPGWLGQDPPSFSDIQLTQQAQHGINIGANDPQAIAPIPLTPYATALLACKALVATVTCPTLLTT
jgi:hypothetical protein